MSGKMRRLYVKRDESRVGRCFLKGEAKRKLGECAHRWLKYGVGERHGKKLIGRYVDAYHGSVAMLLCIAIQFYGPPGVLGKANGWGMWRKVLLPHVSRWSGQGAETMYPGA